MGPVICVLCSKTLPFRRLSALSASIKTGSQFSPLNIERKECMAASHSERRPAHKNERKNKTREKYSLKVVVMVKCQLLDPFYCSFFKFDDTRVVHFLVFKVLSKFPFHFDHFHRG